MSFSGIEIIHDLTTPIRVWYPDVTFSGVEICNSSPFQRNYLVAQLKNGYPVKETVGGTWESALKIDINPPEYANPEVQTIIDTYSGLAAGTHILTAQQLFDTATAAGGGVMNIKFLEQITTAVTVDPADYETIVARIEFPAIDPTTHSFEIL